MNNKIIEHHVAILEPILVASTKANQKVAIIYHGDCDGVVSAGLVGFLLKKVFTTPHVSFISVRTEQFDFSEALEKLESTNPDFTFFLDLSIQDYPEKLQRAVSATSGLTIIYDHHSQTQISIPDKVLYLNPSITTDGIDTASPPPCFFCSKALPETSWN